VTALLDRLARPLADLRISVTDRCNLRCPYCMPRAAFGDEHSFMPRSELLSFEEIARLAALFSSLGVRKIRLTGGEPLLRRELDRLVAMLARLPGIEEVALTTNGMLLAGSAPALARAGLRRVTVSLDALEQSVFAAMGDTRAPVARVLEGIEAAGAAGLHPVKLNMVVRRGVNEHCVLAMAEHFRHRPEIVRFIEYMDVGSTNGWSARDVVPAREVMRAIDARWPLEPLPAERLGEVATRYRYRDGAGEVGFIHSISEPFCGTCTRARLSAGGTLYTCLFATRGTDLRGLLRGGASDEEIARAIASTWRARSDRYSAERAKPGAAQPGARRRGSRARRIEMSYIGG